MGGDKKSDSVIRVGRFLLIALTFLLVVPVVIGQSRHRNPTRPTISSFIASPSQILAGSSTTLSWNVANASSIVITPGSFSTTTLAGSTTMSPTSTTVYTLTATSTSGSSTATTSVYVDTTPPTIPASLTASATGTSTISLVWAPSSDSSGPGLAGYNIYRCAGASCTPSTLIGTSKNGSYGDTGLATSTVYTYAVAAYDTLGLASAKSSPASATTQGATPPTISSFVANPTSIFAGQSSTLSWSVSNSTSLSISDGVGSVTNTTSTVVNPTASSTYTLTASNTIGTTTAQATITVSSDSTPPSTPAGLTATAESSSTISLNWAGSSDTGGPGLAGYNIYRCTGASCTPSTVIGTSTTASHTDTGLTASTTYTYAVAAYDTLGLASAMSSPASATTEVATAGTPTLVQHVATAMEQNPATTVTIPLPNAAGSGNALILGVQYQSSGSVTSVTDNGGNKWVAGPKETNDGHTMALYYALNVAGGTQTIKIVFAGNPIDVQAEASEFYNVAAASALDGASSSNSSTTAGEMTTSAVGDLIYEWGADLSDSNETGGAYNATTSIAAGAGFTLLSADLQVGAADQYEVQPAAGAVTPTFTAPGTSTWGSLAIALEAAPTGTLPAPGIRIVHVQHTLLDSITVQGRPTPAVIQFPSSGNLLVGLYNGAQCLISSVSDSEGNPWNVSAPIATFEGGAASECPGGAQIVYAANAVTGPTLSNIKATHSGQETSGDDTFDLFDVTGAASAAFDKAETADGDQTSGGNLTTVSLTPSAANELVFNNTAIDYQTINGVVGSGYIFDADVNAADDDVTGPNPTPNSTLDEDNGYAHIFEPAMGTATFVYTYNSPANGGVQYWASVSAAFAQASTDSTPPSVPQNLVVSGVTTSSVTLAWSASTDPNYASSTLSYRIYRNGAQVGTTTGGTISYTDTGLIPATSYTYTVSASDPAGNVSAQSQVLSATTSSSLAVAVPVISAEPASQTAQAGGTATFSVTASGSPAPSYQWQSEAAGSGSFANITGATGAIYTLSDVQSSQSGSQYLVIVSNSQGSVTSSPVTLTVTSTVPAISYVQSQWCQDDASQVTSRSCAITPNSGDAVVAFCYSSTQNSAYTVSDSKGNSYAVDAASSRSGISVAIAHAVNVAGGADTVTCSVCKHRLHECDARRVLGRHTSLPTRRGSGQCRHIRQPQRRVSDHHAVQ